MLFNARKPAALAINLLPAALFLILWGNVSGSPVIAPRPLESANGRETHGFAGSATCSGRGCHGAVTPNNAPALRQDEFTTWVRHDKHFGAFEVLKSARAERMAENLAPLNGGKKINAFEDARCLACHTTPEHAAGTTAEARALQAQGIGCEACHGPALKNGNGWLNTHTTPAWKQLDSVAKEKQGMRMLGEPRTQAQVCVGCHVGAAAQAGLPARDLNHDLIAAGHPRLTFELSSYRANLPAHWRRDKYQADPGYEAKIWAAGRVESARASLDLLTWRATAETADRNPWPEFAESACFACHANFRLERTDWRKRDRYLDSRIRKPGSLPYNKWFSSGLEELARAVGVADEPLQNLFAALSRRMSEATPDRKEVIKLAEAASREVAALGAEARTATYNAAQVRAVMKELLAIDPKKLEALDWDETTQFVYALAALNAAAPPRDAAQRQKVSDQFTKLYKSLAFPAGYDSPATFRTTETMPDSDRLTREVSALIKLLGGT